MTSTSKQSFDIKIAVIGLVSVGKSTLINALLGGKYTEVSPQKSTLGVSYFRLNPSSHTPIGCCARLRWNHEDEILSEISSDNQRLQNSQSATEGFVEEKIFDIPGVKLCECCPDTKLVLVDIPGIDYDSGSGSKYRDFCEKKWIDFDVAIVVLDGKRAVKSIEQVQVLQFVKANLEQRRNIPVIILYNKVDALERGEGDANLEEARKMISFVYNIPGRLDLANQIVNKRISANGLQQLQNDMGYYVPVFLPVSARNIYLYSLASKGNATRLQRIEMPLVEKLGREQIGLRQWNKLSECQRYQVAIEAISDPKVRKEALESSFQTSLKMILSFYVGKKAQGRLILAQFERDLSQLPADRDLAKNVATIWTKMNERCGSEPTLSFTRTREIFWEKFNRLTNTARILELASDVMHVLIEYHEFIHSTFSNSREEEEEIIQRAVQYLNGLKGDMLQRWKYDGGDEALVLSRNPHFCRHFSELNWALKQEQAKYGVYNRFHPDWNYIDNRNAFWMFCQWMERVDEERKAQAEKENSLPFRCSLVIKSVCCWLRLRKPRPSLPVIARRKNS